jgi:hypothetical protein
MKGKFPFRKVKILHDDYCMGTIITLSDRFNEFWGNCYEEAKTSVHRYILDTEIDMT